MSATIISAPSPAMACAPKSGRASRSASPFPRIVEFYGATEGNVSMLNYDGKVGAVGRVPSYMRMARCHARMVRFDVEQEMPVRGPDGLCIECGPDEAGEAHRQDLDKRAGRDFEGYTKASDTQKKILHDVFKKGDAWFRTGDLMRRDEHGYFYFVDRIGDTFRWKGENVATSEVAEALGVVPGIKEANVYGVAVPGADGRAGMAALVVARTSMSPGWPESWTAICRLCPPGVPPPAAGNRNHRHLQAAQGRTGERRFRSRRRSRSALLARSGHTAIRPLDKARYDAMIAGGLKL